MGVEQLRVTKHLLLFFFKKEKMVAVKQRESWVGEEGLGESVRETRNHLPAFLPPFQLSRDQLFPAANQVWRKHNRVVMSEKLLRSWVTSTQQICSWLHVHSGLPGNQSLGAF